MSHRSFLEFALTILNMSIRSYRINYEVDERIFLSDRILFSWYFKLLYFADKNSCNVTLTLERKKQRKKSLFDASTVPTPKITRKQYY